MRCNGTVSKSTATPRRYVRRYICENASTGREIETEREGERYKDTGKERENASTG